MVAMAFSKRRTLATIIQNITPLTRNTADTIFS
jgi:hypothetical protein